MQRSAINCQDCGFSQLCLPFSLSEQEMSKLDDIIQRKRPLHKGDMLFETGNELKSLYAIRTGSFKTFTLTSQGEQQITGFHLPGDVIGFDAINTEQHASYAEALETGMICEIPYHNLENLLGQLTKLRQQMMRLMSQDIQADQQMMLLLNRKTAEQKSDDLASLMPNITKFKAHLNTNSVQGWFIDVETPDIKKRLIMTIRSDAGVREEKKPSQQGRLGKYTMLKLQYSGIEYA